MWTETENPGTPIIRAVHTQNVSRSCDSSRGHAEVEDQSGIALLVVLMDFKPVHHPHASFHGNHPSLRQRLFSSTHMTISWVWFDHDHLQIYLRQTTYNALQKRVRGLAEL